MKKILFIVLCLLGITYLRAEEVTVSTEPIAPKIVELHIIENTPPSSQDKRRKKVENLTGKGVCSGFFVTDMGDILTAGHCAKDATSIEVMTSDGKNYQASVTAVSSTHDLALLHIDKLATPYFKLARSVHQGDHIYIFGSPLGITGTLSEGVVAKLDGDIVLLDCGVLPGNSGSAVINERGDVVGVATAGYRVDFGTTHLNLAQGIDAIWFFLMKVFMVK